MLYLLTFGTKICWKIWHEYGDVGERGRWGREGTSGRTILTMMCVHTPDRGHGDMEGRFGVSL